MERISKRRDKNNYDPLASGRLPVHITSDCRNLKEYTIYENRERLRVKEWSGGSMWKPKGNESG